MSKSRLTKCINGVVTFNGGEYKSGLLPAEMDSGQVREVLYKLAEYEELDRAPIESTNLYRKVINTYGEEGQMIVAMEECSELIQAISKQLRGRDTNVEEEVADVEIMLEQLKLMFDEKLIKNIKEQKLQRLEKRLNNE